MIMGKIPIFNMNIWNISFFELRVKDDMEDEARSSQSFTNSQLV